MKDEEAQRWNRLPELRSDHVARRSIEERLAVIETELRALRDTQMTLLRWALPAGGATAAVGIAALLAVGL